MYIFFSNLCGSKTGVKEESRKMHIKRAGIGIEYGIKWNSKQQSIKEKKMVVL